MIELRTVLYCTVYIVELEFSCMGETQCAVLLREYCVIRATQMPDCAKWHAHGVEKLVLSRLFALFVVVFVERLLEVVLKDIYAELRF